MNEKNGKKVEQLNLKTSMILIGFMIWLKGLYMLQSNKSEIQHLIVVIRKMMSIWTASLKYGIKEEFLLKSLFRNNGFLT